MILQENFSFYVGSYAKRGMTVKTRHVRTKNFILFMKSFHEWQSREYYRTRTQKMAFMNFWIEFEYEGIVVFWPQTIERFAISSSITLWNFEKNAQCSHLETLILIRWLCFVRGGKFFVFRDKKCILRTARKKNFHMQ